MSTSELTVIESVLIGRHAVLAGYSEVYMNEKR